MCENEALYRRVLQSPVLSVDLIASLYHVPPQHVRISPHEPAYSIKITIPRPCVSGDLDDGDTFGGQQYGPLVELEVA